MSFSRRALFFSAIVLVAGAVVWTYKHQPVPPASSSLVPTVPSNMALGSSLTPIAVGDKPPTTAARIENAGDHEHGHGEQAGNPLPAPRRLGEAWTSTAPEPLMAAFQEWTSRYLAANDEAKAALVAEGVALARQRLEQITHWIQTNPELALARAVPPWVRAQLPAEVQTWVEQTVNATARYDVLCVLPAGENQSGGLVRTAHFGDKSCRVFTFGRGLEYVTRAAAPVQGIVVPRQPGDEVAHESVAPPTHWMALDPQPARFLEPSEVETHRAAVGDSALCEATGESWTSRGTPAALLLGGEVRTFASPDVASNWLAGQGEVQNLDEPVAPDNLPTAASSYTEGRKRFILFRVDFPDYAGEVMTTNEALNLMVNMGQFMAEVSHGRLTFAPVGEGSDITPTMRLPEVVENYQDMGKLLGACRTAATALGYDMNKYDFYFVCTAGKPTASFAGLGYVGGVGFWLANRYWDVRTGAHEFGHNLGLGHANWWNTSGTSMLGAGTNEEYGDPFDTMGGSGGGSRHFSSFSKNKLGWIPDADCPTVTSSGFYRLYAHDDPRASGVRGLRFRRSNGDYWMEFRQLFTGNRAMMNGLAFRWVGGSTTLLDATPGSDGNKDDHPLVIGRTFSDRKLGLHVTPVGKGHTYPESLDVMVYVGDFPNNRPPKAQVVASSTQVAANAPVQFSVTATDPDGDALAYYWDFGNGNYSVDNQPTATQSFSSAGEYAVHCIVSDMKGGVGVGAVVVRVGSPTTFQISGRVVTTNAQPVPGMWVRVNASRYAITQDDGSFVLTQLGAGSYSVNVYEPFYNELNFVNPYFNNPLTLGPSFVGADFVQFPGSLYITTTLVGKGSRWKYLDDGSNQGTAWRQPGFNDASWSSGNAPLGYGEGGVTTTLSYGGVSTNKHITYYFRTTFTNQTSPGAFTNLVLEVRRDDGVLVWLNGQEVFRDNMPTGTVTSATRAVSAVEPDNFLRAELSPTLLQNGVNTLAVEIHQVEPTSSDIFFDLSLAGVSRTNATSLPIFYLASPRPGDVFTQPINVTLAAVAQSDSATINQVRFYANDQLLIADSTAPYGGFWPQAPVGQHTLHAVAVMADGRMLTSAPVAITIRMPEPPPPPAVTNLLIAPASRWSFFTGPTGAPPTWATLDFDASSWSNGLAELGYGENDEATRLSYGPNSNNKWITAYFRRAFVVDDPYSITNALLQLKRDDGAVVYLNGQEILRDLMPEGEITFNTLATAATDDDGKTFFSFPFSSLPFVPGTNVLAVEVHQNSATSSDLSFDLGLTVWLSTNRPRDVYWVSPEAGTERPAGAMVLSVHPVAGGGPLFQRVQYYAEGQLLAEVGPPFNWTWVSPPVARVVLMAVAVDTAGNSVTSAPVQVTFTAPAPLQSGVAWGEVWKYWDERQPPAGDWTSITYSDYGWKAGAARLGYGGDGERTVLNDGGDPSFRHITAWFRKTFMASPAGLTQLELQLICDDGAVVYLNGQEVFRHNMPAGLVSYNSLALTAKGGADETTPVMVTLSPTLLRTGTNVLAVEVHQSSITSSDLGFDLQLIGRRMVPATPSTVYVTAPAHGTRLFAPASIPLTAFALANGQSARRVEYRANGQLVGSATTYPYAVTWQNPPLGEHSLVAVGEFEGGLAVTSAPVTITVAAVPPAIQPTSTTWIPSGATWRYWDSVAAPLSGWAAAAFDDSSWPQGQARFGWGWDGERTEITSGRITHYFRHTFVVTNPALYTELVFQLVRDDGAVVYLNGREVFRSNMPAGAVTPTTTASGTVNTPDETTFFETIVPVAGSGFRIGTNVVAVELHQSSATSSDGGFDLRLMARGTTEPRLFLLQPAAGQTLVAGQPLTLEAALWAGSGLTAGSIEFFADGQKIGQTVPGETRWVWEAPALGAYQIVARARVAGGMDVESAPVVTTIQYPPYQATLINTGAMWRYWDRGSLPATNWNRRSYSDGAWSTGTGRFGYGDDGEITVLQSGPSNNKYPAYYFRRWFSVPQGVNLTNLVFRLLRDDGAVVYLNGGEVFRSNMPQGPVNYNTYASTAVSGGDEQTYFEVVVPVVGIMPGLNLVAVEVHQNSATSSDLAFDMALEGRGYQGGPATALAPPPQMQGNQIQLSWPTNMHGWELYSSPTLGPLATWEPVGGSLLQTNGFFLFRTTPTGGMRYFRLEQR